MDFRDKARNQTSIHIGDAHHLVKSDVLARCPSGASGLAALVQLLRKGKSPCVAFASDSALVARFIRGLARALFKLR